MGWDRQLGYQLYQSDPSGNYSGWKATCIGNNSSSAVSQLKQEYKEGETTLTDALDLSVKVCFKLHCTLIYLGASVDFIESILLGNLYTMATMFFIYCCWIRLSY